MNLTDAEILELNELCNVLIDGTLTASQRDRLSHLLSSSEEARQFYVRAMGLSASLYHYAGEMQADEMTDTPGRGGLPSIHKNWWVGLAIAASVMIALWLVKNPKRGLAVAPQPREYVARLTASKDCQWIGAKINPNDSILRGQHLELSRGFAEITFDTGARIVLEGPASLDIDSAWNATLLRGTLKANVPPEAIGFAISNPSVDVVDLGTEFTMVAYPNGSSDVLVLKGAVEATAGENAAEQTIVLRENESRRFATNGVSSVRDSARMFAHFNETVLLDRYEPATKFVHWSFDDANGTTLAATVRGASSKAFDAVVQNDLDGEPTPSWTDGRWQRALQFDGHRFARAAFPGISGDAAHTIAFWVKVPEDALLSDAYAIVAWDTTSRKLNAHPVHISWNRNPAEGTVGVLRTDYGGGFALGATPLRDGRWHHAAIVFAVGENDKSPVEVKQYVDGRLEGEGKSSPRGVRRASDEDPVPQPNIVWFGRRLGHERQRKDRFRGALDEVFIADRALGPREIVQLMRDNQPSVAELAQVMR
jgi:Concanavalin A-like lectin/glucanases superfamily/FecR protein